MVSLYSDLTWLPRAPENFTALCRSALDQPEGLGLRLQALASSALDENQLVRLAKTLARAKGAGLSLAPLIPYRIALIGNGTMDFIVPALVASAARHGIALECIPGGYDQAAQECLNPDSAMYRAELNAVLLALDWRGLPFRSSPGQTDGANEAIEQVLDYLRLIRGGIQQNSGATCIFQTLAAPPETAFGSLDRVLPGAPRYVLDGVNRGIAEAARESGSALLDAAALAETVGLANWHSPTAWNMAKVPFSQHLLPFYAEHVARLIAALCGKSRRCLVLDLDNTMWGGIIGDDGLKGIRVAQGDAQGEAFLNFQRYALSLRERGVVLAVCSKNEDDTARLPFREHPDMLIREEHIAVFQANWTDKATNIQAIAKELNLGLESFVFADDNPFERNLVRGALPQVAVPEMPADPAFYARVLSAAGYFEAAVFSGEDLQRAAFYEGNAKRAVLQKSAGDIRGYLASLQMEITFQHFNETGRARIAQLVQKSNQFNLTTRRYSEADIARLEADPTCFTMQIRLTDTLGDNGMISVVIGRQTAPETMEIDTWLMSCRVLGRCVETMVLRELLLAAARRNVQTIVGVFRPTEKNKMVKDHYSKLGFELAEENPDGTMVWRLSVAEASVPADIPMTVHSSLV